MTVKYNPKTGFPHTLLSDSHKCKSCGKGIKARLVKIRPKAPELCYKCYKESNLKHRNALHNVNQILRNNH